MAEPTIVCPNCKTEIKLEGFTYAPSDSVYWQQALFGGEEGP